MISTASATSSVGTSGQRRGGRAGSVMGLVVGAPSFGRLPLMLAREQRGLGDAQAIDNRGGGNRHPQDDMHPEGRRSEEHTSELQSLMRISYAVFCLKKKKQHT